MVSRISRFESLERRLALAVTAAVVDGDLVIDGDADGPVAIAATGGGTYQVTDNGVAIGGMLDGVTNDITIKIDNTADAANTVTLDLTGQTVNNVSADLGNGANSLAVTGGAAASFSYEGGTGADTVTLASTITEETKVNLGSGDNSLAVSGSVGSLSVHGGSGDDTVQVAATAEVENVNAHLGSGDNSFTLDGAVNGHVHVSAGAGDDTVLLADGSSVGKGVMLNLGSGDNTTTLAGSIGKTLTYRGGEGNDKLTIAATAEISDNVFARLGEGDNSVTHLGKVGGDFRISSMNADDVVDTVGGIIDGDEILQLGKHGKGSEHHGLGAEKAHSPTLPPQASSQVVSALKRLRG